MFQLRDLLNTNFFDLMRKTSLEEKLKDGNYPLEDFLKEDDAISCIKLMGKNTKKYFNSEKIKRLIKLITEEPEEEDHLKGHKFPYIASEILKLDCPFISQRFILNEQEYDEEYPEIVEDDKEDKEIDFDFYKNEFDNDFSKIEEKLENLKKKKEDKKIDDNKKEKNKENNNKDNENNEEEKIKKIEDERKEENEQKKENENGKKDGNDENNTENKVNNNDENKTKEINEEKNEDNLEKNIEKNYDNIEVNDKESENKINEGNEDKNKENIDKNKEENKNDNKIINENNINIGIIYKEKKDEKIKEKKKEPENKEEEKKENKVEVKEGKINEEDNTENKKDIKEDKKEDKVEEKKEDTKEEIKEEKKEDIKEEKKEENDTNKNNSDEKNKDEKEENINKENEEKKDIDTHKDKEKNKIEEKVKEEKEENKHERDKNNNKEIKPIEQSNEEKEKEKQNAKEEIKEEKKEELKEEIKGEKNEEIKEEKKEEIKEDTKAETKEEIKETKKEKVNEEKEGKDAKTEEKEKNSEGEEKEVKELNNEREEDIQKEETNNIEDKKEEIKKEKEIKEEDNNEPEPENNQEEEANEELDNIIVDNEAIEAEPEEKEEKNNKNEENKKEDEDSLSIEGEIEDFYNIKKTKPKKKYENKPNNEYLDLLLNFVMNDKPELNYVLSGYFANVMITLINNYPSQILKYLYLQRKDAIKKILKHSNQKAFAILAVKIINLESYIVSNNSVETNVVQLISSNIDYRNGLIGEMVKSINLEGYIGEDGIIDYGVDIEAKFAFLKEIINENTEIVDYLIKTNDVYTHIFDILNTDLYNNNENNTDNVNEDKNYNNKYFIYGLFIDLITKLLKTAINKDRITYPTISLVNYINKEKNEITFNENIVKTLSKIIKSNFLPKKNLIVEKDSTISYEGLGILSIRIVELIKEVINFMKEIPNQFDNILIRNNFWQKSIDYFFKYQWNNIYHNQFVELFNIYLLNEKKHKTLTDYLFNNLKLHELLIDYLNQDKEKENKDKNPKQKTKFSFKSGNSTTSGIYPHVIDLIYKIQSIRGLEIFTREEKTNLKIKNYGEFEFSKDEKSNKLIQKLNISENINNLLKDSKEWNKTTNEIVLPIIRVYEGQLCKKEEKKSDDSDSSDIQEGQNYKYRGNSGALLQQLLNVIKRDTTKSIKRFSLPLSRNDKNIGKIKNDNKGSIRDKLLNKGGIHSQKIFEDEEDEKNKDNNNQKNDNENKNEKNNEENKEYNDTNYWEVGNGLPENIKKDVDKKTNIIFNYNPLTYENDNKDNVSEEDELLSVAMGLEQKEKMEKNKKLKLTLPYKIKPFNLKAKTNPVQNLYSSSNDNNNKFKKNIYIKNNDEDKEKDENISNGENEENEEEEEGVVKKEEKEEKNDDKIDIIKNIKKNVDDKNDEEIKKEEKEEDENNKNYNDVNYWGISSRMYLNEKEMEDCLNDL